MNASEAFDELYRAGLEPLLRAIRKKIYEMDGVRGKVPIALGPNEREELANLINRPPTIAKVDLRELDSALRKSRFQVGLLEVLEAGYGRLVTRRQEREQSVASWKNWLAQLRAKLLAESGVADWLETLEAEVTPSGNWVRRAYRADPDRAARAVLAVGKALARLPSLQRKHELLAIFASEISGDPHVFDVSEPAGILLEHALLERFGSPPEGLRPSEKRALLLDRAGLGVDQVSSTILVSNLMSVWIERSHPVVEAMAVYGGAWALTLDEVRRWTEVRARRRRAYVVENPPVFEYLLRRVSDAAPERRPTLICTGGFLSAAAVRLLDLLAAGGTELWYGGDFDRNGLAIGSWLAERYSGGFRPWRFGPEEYRSAVTDGGKELSAENRAYLMAMEGPLAPTARALTDEGIVAYQERVADLLAKDVLAEM